MADPRISQFLPTVKCSNCNADVEFRKLGEHICSAAPPVPGLPPLPEGLGKSGVGRRSNDGDRNYRDRYNDRTRSPSPTSSSPYGHSPVTSKASNESSRSSDASTGSQNKPSLPFLEKYKNKSSEPAKSPMSPPQKNSQDDYFSNDFPSGSNRIRSPDPNGARSRSPQYDRYGDRLDDRGYGDKDWDRAPTSVRSGDNGDYGRGYEQARSPGGRNAGDKYDQYPDEYGRSPRSPGGGGRYSPSQDRRRQPGSNDGDSFVDDIYGDYGTERRPSKESDGYGRRKQSDQRRPSNNSGGALDSLMDDLMKDMDDGFDINDYGRPSVDRDPPHPQACNGCEELFDRRDEIINAAGKAFHRPCYNCTACHARFDDRHPYREFKGKLYCERDYYKMTQPPARICAACNNPITGETPIKALGQYFHPSHLKCQECRKPINPKQGLVEHKGKVFCREDFTNLYLPKCRACGLAVEKEAVTSSDGKLDGKWHRECFGCHTCRKPFPDSTFYVFENAPYCRRHYHKLNNSLCRTCDDPIEGPCAQTIENWRFHPSCFTCAVCRVTITDTYYQYDNKTYCETHILELQKQRKVKAEKRQTYFKRI